MFWSSGKWAHVVSTWYSLKWFQLSQILQHQHFIFTGTVLDVPFRPFVYLQCVIHCWYNFMNAWSSLWCPYHSLFSFVLPHTSDYILAHSVAYLLSHITSNVFALTTIQLTYWPHVTQCAIFSDNNASICAMLVNISIE